MSDLSSERSEPSSDLLASSARNPSRNASDRPWSRLRRASARKIWRMRLSGSVFMARDPNRFGEPVSGDYGLAAFRVAPGRPCVDGADPCKSTRRIRSSCFLPPFLRGRPRERARHRSGCKRSGRLGPDLHRDQGRRRRDLAADALGAQVRFRGLSLCAVRQAAEGARMDRRALRPPDRRWAVRPAVPCHPSGLPGRARLAGRAGAGLLHHWAGLDFHAREATTRAADRGRPSPSPAWR